MGGPRKAKPALKNAVEVKGDTVSVVIAGPQAKATAEAMLAKFVLAVERAHMAHDKVYVRVNLHGLTLDDVTVDARLAMKEAFRQPFYRLAAVGDSHLLEVAMYLMRAGGADKKARYFTSDRVADHWLADERRGRQRPGKLLLVIAGLIGLTGIASLVGWATENQLLTRILPDLRPINPMAAVGLLALSAAIILDWMQQRRMLWLISGIMAVLGVLALSPVGIDRWLFGGAVAAAGGHTALADSAAVCFVLSAACFTLLTTKRLAARRGSAVLAAGIVLLALLNIFGLLYFRDEIYSWSPQFVMALQLALSFALAGSLLFYLSLGNHHGKPLPRIGAIGWLVVLSLCALQIATYASWRQSVIRNEADASQAFKTDVANISRTLSERIRAYTDALHGFGALFASSDTVSQGEFETYYQVSGVGVNYPGLRALSYISRVEERQIPAFVAAQRADRSLLPQGNPSFTVRQKADKQVHYIITYLAGSPNNSSIGNDLANDIPRLQAFEQASASGEPTASGTLQFQANNTQPAGRGFFITIPVKQKGSQTVNGFVNAVFTHDGFFGAALSGSASDDAIGLRIRDVSDGSLAYGNDRWRAVSQQGGVLQASSVVSVSNRSWQLEAKVPGDYSLTRNQAGLPATILVAGQLLALLLVALFVLLGRSRSRALALADTITVDLQKERNRAVNLQQKDEAILSSIGDAVFAIDSESKIALFNLAAEQISGYSAVEAIGQPYKDILKFVYEDGDRENTEFIEQALGGQVASMKNHTYLVRKDGSHVPVADSAAPIRDAAGGIIGVIVVFRDATSDRALSTERSQLQAILASLPVGVFVVEAPDGRPLLTNAKAEELLGRDINKTAGVGEYTKAYELTKPDGKPYPEAELPLAQTLHSGKPAVRDDIMVRFASGKQIAMRATSAPIVDESGVMRRAVVVSEDMTKERELDKAKTEFVSLASHQLRTPLSAINWYAEILMDESTGKLTEQQREYAQEIYEGNQRMVELVNSLLDVSRLDLGKLSNKPEPTQLDQVIDSLAKELQPTIKQKQLKLMRQVASDIPPVNADPKLLRMIVQNLLSNAVKYTPEQGAVTVTLATAVSKVAKTAGLPDGNYAHFTVNDTGYGIPKAQQDKIFSKLFRADNVQALDVEGTGLGLYIVKQVVEKLGGVVWFDSIESVGTTFHVLLPYGSHATIKPNHEETT